MDTISKAARSRNMSRIRAKNTIPELLVRKALFSKGYRYRIHYPLPGRPDIVFPSKRRAILIQGCFWHGHNCHYSHQPKSNIEFWKNKITANKKRDKKNFKHLKNCNWALFLVWECQIHDKFDITMKKIERFLL